MAAISNTHYDNLAQGKDCCDCLRNKCTDLKHEVYKKLNSSILFIVGDEDTVICNKLSRDIFVQMVMGKRADKQLKFIEIKGMDHGPF